jgi:hypothetical protein
MSVIIAAPAHWLKKGGILTRSSPASTLSSRQPDINVIKRICHEVLNSSTDPTPTPAFPSIDTHHG